MEFKDGILKLFEMCTQYHDDIYTSVCECLMCPLSGLSDDCPIKNLKRMNLEDLVATVESDYPDFFPDSWARDLTKRGYSFLRLKRALRTLQGCHTLQADTCYPYSHLQKIADLMEEHIEEYHTFDMSNCKYF